MKKIIIIFIVGLFIGASFVPNITGKIPNNANILIENALLIIVICFNTQQMRTLR